MNMTNTKNLRIINQRKVIETLMEQDSCSKNDLARLTGLSLASIHNILTDLIKTNEVFKSEDMKMTGGRPSHMYQLNANYSKTLCLSLYRNSKRVHLIYRVYNLKDEILIENEVIKLKMNIHDIYDIIDTVTSTYGDITMFGISIPGVIQDGFVEGTSIEGFDNINLKELIANRYGQKLVLGNDVNTAAIGFYMSQPDYENVAFLFQPSSNYSGIGIINNGELMKGKSHLVGEARFLPINYSQDIFTLLTTPQGCEELLEKQIQTIIAMIDPEAIGIACVMVDNYQPIINYLKSIYGNRPLPQLIQVNNMTDFTLSGIHQLCKEEIVDKKMK